MDMDNMLICKRVVIPKQESLHIHANDPHIYITVSPRSNTSSTESKHINARMFRQKTKLLENFWSQLSASFGNVKNHIPS